MQNGGYLFLLNYAYLHNTLNPASTYQSSVKFKKLGLFFIASSALIATGFLWGDHQDWKMILLLIYCNLTGVFLVYRLNDCIDQDAGLSLNIKHFFEIHLHKLVVAQFFLILLPLAYLWLPYFSWIVLIVAALLGTLYSLTFTINHVHFRIKNVFILKNVLIGLTWGALILIGAGHIDSEIVTGLFYFVSAQVMIGSMVRDVPDLEKDREHHVQSFPVVLGIQNTIRIMHVLNLASLLTVLLLPNSIPWLIAFGTVIVWRFFNLIQLQKAPKAKIWSQTANLFTCILIFVVALIVYYAGTIS